MVTFVANKFQKTAFQLLLATSVMAASLSPVYAEEMWEYEMQPGDHIWKIAHELLTDGDSWQEVSRINGVTDNDRIMAAGTVLRIPQRFIQARHAEITLIEVSGPVNLIKADTTTTPATQHLQLAQGDTVSTGENGSALLRFEDKTEVLITPESTLEINKAGVIGNKKQIIDIDVLLKSGEAEVRANPDKVPGSRFIIETPSAFATTRGTVYRVLAMPSATAAEVTQGRIDVSNSKGQTAVKARFGTIAKKDTAPSRPEPLLPPPVMEPTNTLRYLPARVEWQSVPGATGYRGQLSGSATFQSLLVDQLAPVTKLNLPASLPDGQYWLKLKAASPRGLQGLEAVYPITIDARPFPPVIQAPLTRDAVYAGVVNFQWAQPEGVAQYRLELAQDETFSAPIINTTLSATTFETEITTPGQYVWRVTSIDAQGKQGPVGFTTPITVKPVPASPELAAPVAEEGQLRFAWQPDTVAVSYQMQLAKDSDFTELVTDQTVTQSQATIEKPEVGTYYLRVRGIDADQFAGEWSATQTVDVPVDSYWPAILWGILSVAMFL